MVVLNVGLATELGGRETGAPRIAGPHRTGVAGSKTATLHGAMIIAVGGSIPRFCACATRLPLPCFPLLRHVLCSVVFAHSPTAIGNIGIQLVISGKNSFANNLNAKKPDC